MSIKRLLTLFFGLAIIIGLLVIDHWIFKTWLRTTHLKWYLANGASIGIVSSIATMAFSDINKHIGLISSNPLHYLGSCLQLVGLPIWAIGTLLRTKRDETQSIFDFLMAIPFLIALVGIQVIWLVVIAPPQYFLYLVCGAPSRIFSHSERQPIARWLGLQLEINEISQDDKVPPGWWSVNLKEKPIALTNTFVTLLFLIGKPLIG